MCCRWYTWRGRNRQFSLPSKCCIAGLDGVGHGAPPQDVWYRFRLCIISTSKVRKSNGRNGRLGRFSQQRVRYSDFESAPYSLALAVAARLTALTVNEALSPANSRRTDDAAPRQRPSAATRSPSPPMPTSEVLALPASASATHCGAVPVARAAAHIAAAVRAPDGTGAGLSTGSDAGT